MIGFDLDGVLCYNEERPKFNRKAGIKAHKQKTLDYISNAQVKIRPPACLKYYAIITSRPRYTQEATLDWLSRNGFCGFEIHFIDRPRIPIRNMIDFKEGKIKELGVGTFFEDDPKIVKELRKRCPLVMIIEVAKKDAWFHLPE